jgi:hypothetical protein
MVSVNHIIDESGTPSSQGRNVRVCRTIDCGRCTLAQDEFCTRCREEIDALRAMARRRFVIWGASAIKKTAGR